MNDCACRKVDHIDRAIAEFSHKQALTAKIDGHMINAPGDAFQRNGALDIKSRCRLSATVVRCSEANEHGNGQAYETAG